MKFIHSPGRRPSLDLTGERFGRLVAVQFMGPVDGKVRWRCLCDCGTEATVTAKALRGKNTTSCGCRAAENLRAGREKRAHGMKGTREFDIWCGLRARCNNPKNPAYANYGGRGITVCERWAKFENFLRDMGPAPADHEIDRRDVNGNYEPGNCRWVTVKQQANNKTNNRMVGELTVAEWAEEHGLPYQAVYSRFVRRGDAPRRDQAK